MPRARVSSEWSSWQIFISYGQCYTEIPVNWNLQLCRGQWLLPWVPSVAINQASEQLLYTEILEGLVLLFLSSMFSSLPDWLWEEKP